MRILPFVSITIALAALVGSAVLLHQVRRHVARCVAILADAERVRAEAAQLLDTARAARQGRSR